MAKIKYCKQCADTFKPVNSRQIYCSEECCQKFHYDRTYYECICQNCDKLFEGKYQKAKYCSSKCRGEHRRKVNQEIEHKKTLSKGLTYADFELLEPYGNVDPYCRPACPQLGF